MQDFNVRSPGHEGAGVVVQLGAGVTNWKIGDRAGVRPMWDVCHNCTQCWNGEEQYCLQVIHTGMMTTGSYQQYVVTPAIYTAKIPDEVPDEAAGPIMCSASTMHCALREGGFKAGDWIVFPGGAGGVGIQGVQLARYVFGVVLFVYTLLTMLWGREMDIVAIKMKKKEMLIVEQGNGNETNRDR